MAKFNENTVNMEHFNQDKISDWSMVLGSFLTDNELDRLKADFRKKNEGKSPKDEGFIPYWKFCLDNIKVSYGGENWHGTAQT